MSRINNKRKRDNEDNNQPRKKIKYNYVDNDDISPWIHFNKYQPESCQNIWVSATKTKNYLLNDPILDWLAYHGKHSSSLVSNSSNENQNLNRLFEFGNRFETEVENYLINKFGD